MQREILFYLQKLNQLYKLSYNKDRDFRRRVLRRDCIRAPHGPNRRVRGTSAEGFVGISGFPPGFSPPFGIFVMGFRGFAGQFYGMITYPRGKDKILCTTT